MMFRLTSSNIDRDSAVAGLKNSRVGGLVIFEGWVRDHNEGKAVSSLEYQIYKELALSEGEKVLQEARTKFNIEDAICVHREGHLKLGDSAILIATTAAHRDAAYQASRYIIDQIKLRLPIWKKEHYTDHAPVWVFCKDHSTHVHFEERDYYLKQARVVDQRPLKAASVLVIGAGGLGCPALSALACAGVGQITIVDHDQIEFSNLHRQPLYSPSLVGEKKALIAQKKLLELNPFIQVKALTEFVHAGNIAALIEGQNLVLDCTDNMKVKLEIHDACFKAGVPLISASVFQYQGQLRTFTGSNGCWRCTLKQTPDDTLLGNCNDFGVVAPTLGVLGSLQASEALLLLQNQTNNTTDSTLFWNLRTFEQMRIKNTLDADCSFCQQSLAPYVNLEPHGLEVSAQDLDSHFELIDIRDKSDAELETLMKPSDKKSKKTALYCHRGIRSLKWVKKLRDQGWAETYSLRGGATALSDARLSMSDEQRGQNC